MKWLWNKETKIANEHILRTKQRIIKKINNTEKSSKLKLETETNQRIEDEIRSK